MLTEMGYDYIRSSQLSARLALGLGLALCLDTPLAVLLWLLGYDFSQEATYEKGFEAFTFRHSVSDVVILCFCKACCLCIFYAFAIARPLALVVTVSSTVYLLVKAAFFRAWTVTGGTAKDIIPPVILVLAILGSSMECIAVWCTKYSWEDPDWELAEKLEAERERAAASNRKGLAAPLLTDEERPLEERPQRTAHEAEESKSSMLYELLCFAAPDYGLLVAGFFFILLSSLFKLAIPNFASRCLTVIIEGFAKGEAHGVLDSFEFRQNVFYFCFCTAGLAFFACLRIWCTAKAEVRLVARLQRILFVAILRHDIAYHDETGTGSLTSRLTSDSTLLGSILTTNVNVAVQSSINLLGSVAYLFVLDYRLAAAYLSIVLLFFAATRAFGAFAKRLQMRIQSLKAESNNIADQAIALIRLVRAFGTEDWEKGRYDRRIMQNVEAECRVKMVYTVYVPVVFLIQNGLALTVLLLGSYLVGHGYMTAASLTTFYFYSTTVQDAMQSLSDNVLSILTGLGAGHKIFEIIRHKPHIPVKGGLTPAQPSQGAVTFEEVTFNYPVRAKKRRDSLAGLLDKEEGEVGKEEARPVIEKLNLHVPPGERLAIVGLSGSGKSSLLSLLLRYFEPSGGRILLDGVDIRSLDPRWLKAQIGIVTQDPMLFGISIRDNIAYGRAYASPQDVEEAAKVAAIHDFITSLPNGYDELVGERGVTLSGGQRQRIAIARAVLRKPRLLILDEATSALDAHSENSVQQAINDLQRQTQCTCITIAHRLSTVQDASRILVMAKGRVVESGTHGELLALNGVYRALVQRQLHEDTIAQTHST